MPKMVATLIVSRSPSAWSSCPCVFLSLIRSGLAMKPTEYRGSESILSEVRSYKALCLPGWSLGLLALDNQSPCCEDTPAALCLCHEVLGLPNNSQALPAK